MLDFILFLFAYSIIFGFQLFSLSADRLQRLLLAICVSFDDWSEYRVESFFLRLPFAKDSIYLVAVYFYFRQHALFFLNGQLLFDKSSL